MAAVADAKENNLAEPLNSDAVAPKTTCDKVKRTAVIGCGGGALVVFVCAWIVQGAIYWYATFGCSPGTVGLDNNYRSGEKTDYGDENDNMVPRVTEMSARSETSWGGQPFDLHRISDHGMGHGASAGTWWRYWGPIFDSYVYQDFESESKTTLYMRRNLLQLGVSYRIGRCDEKAPFIDVSEGMNYFTNRWHKFWGMQTGMVLKIYADGQEVAWAKEMNHVTERSMTFQGPGTDEKKYGDATQKRVNGKFEPVWIITMEHQSLLPTWVATGAVMLYADEFYKERMATAKEKAKNGNSKKVESPQMLVSLSVKDEAGKVKMLYNATSPSKVFLEAHNKAHSHNTTLA